MASPLLHKVAVVTGASRGVGKGVALGLGEAGATVYVTGRTVQAGVNRLPGTIRETAEQVTRLGGQGIAVCCDHRDDAQVEALFRQVREEQGRIDVLVNNAIAFPGGEPPKDTPFWELPISVWDQLHNVGLRSHYVASVFAAPLMIAQQNGLIVNISSHGGGMYLLDVPYGVAKAAVDRLAADMAHELRPHNIAAVSLWPDLVETEWMWLHPERWKPEGRPTAQLTGRAVAALAADAGLMAKSGQVLVVTELAQVYGLTDVNGVRPPVSPHVAAIRGRSRP